MGQKIKKSSGKNSWNQINQFLTKKNSGEIPFFPISKMAQNQFLNWVNSLKLPKIQFHEKKFDLFDFTSFLPGLFRLSVTELFFYSCFILVKISPMTFIFKSDSRAQLVERITKQQKNIHRNLPNENIWPWCGMIFTYTNFYNG